MASTLAAESFWVEKSRYNTAERQYYESLQKMDGIATLAATPVSTEILDRIAAVEKENANLRQMVEKLQVMALESQSRLTAHHIAFQELVGGTKEGEAAVKAAAANSQAADAARIREERLVAYAAMKSKKPALIAKSTLILDVKPWDDETDLEAMETEIRKIACDGLLWGASKFVPVAFGIQKLSISCVVEDEKVSIDWLTEEIEKLEDFVQSVDIAAFNKI